MTWMLIADDASEDELRELAAHQRELAEEQRAYDRTIAYIDALELPGLDGCRPGAGPERTLDFTWPRTLYARLYVFLTAIWPC